MDIDVGTAMDYGQSDGIFNKKQRFGMRGDEIAEEVRLKWE